MPPRRTSSSGPRRCGHPRRCRRAGSRGGTRHPGGRNGATRRSSPGASARTRSGRSPDYLPQHLDGDVDLLHARVRDADVADHPLLLQHLQVAHDVAVHHPTVRPVVLIELDRVDPEDLPRSLDRAAQVVERSVATPHLARATGDTALGGDEHRRRVAAPRAQRLGDDLLVVPHQVPLRGIDVGGVDERHTRLERRVDGRDGVVPGREDAIVVHRQGHGPQTDRRDAAAGE